MIHARVVLGGEHHGLDAPRPAVGIANRHLRLRVGTQPGQSPVAAHLALPLHQPVRVVDRKRHQRRRLVAGVAEHQALVASTLVQVLLGGALDAARDVGRLPAVADHHRAALGVEAQFGVVVADAVDGVARDAAVIVLVLGGDLAGQHDQAGGHQRFGGHPAVGVLR